MTPLFKKLNLGDHREIVVVDAPASFDSELATLDGVKIFRNPKKRSSISFAIFFVQTLSSVAAAAAALKAAAGDPVVWFAYPKASSKNYRCEFNRDNGWEAVGAAGFEGVRQVAIDADWSALRFRRVEEIKTLKRDPERCLTSEGKTRSAIKGRS
ncbi:MAG: hypothetical protein AAF961_16275 [Planctomycetota bacterium]